MSDEIVHILFQVPEGLEFVAQSDVQESLRPHLNVEPDYVSEPGTGRLHLISKGTSLGCFIQALKNVRLLSVYGATIIVARLSIPSTVFNDNDATCEFISNATTNAQWGPTVEQLKIVKNLDAASQPSFRATFRKGELKHGVKSQELAGYVGCAFSKIYPDWKVKMTGYDYDVDTTWFLPPTHDTMDKQGKQCLPFGLIDTQQTMGDEKSPVLLLGLTFPLPDHKYRNRVFLGRTSLNPCIAFCLVRLANPQPGQVVLDMCSGTGTIPIEGASRFPNTFWIGSEVHKRTLSEKALGNLKHSGVQNADLVLSDGCDAYLRPACVDIIVSDWPWGLREGSFSLIQKLYPKFIRQVIRVLRPDGKAYIVTQGQNLMNRVLAYGWCKEALHIDEVKHIGIGGHTVYLYFVQKK